MKHTRLGRTGFKVSVIGIGTEHMRGQPRETVVSTIRAAIERGVNYFDLIFAFPDYLDHMREAFAGCRDQVLLTAHLGSTDKNGQYCKSRSPRRCETSFQDLLSHVGTDYVDVLFLHNVNSVNEWQKIARPGGVLDLAQRLQNQGRARSLAISGHFTPVLELVIESGVVDLIMFPVNLFSHAMPRRRELLELCLRRDIAVVAMKPFGGGKLLNQQGTYRVPKYQTSGEAYKIKIAAGITPAQCLSYVLAQTGVSVALPGVKDKAELAAALHLLEATKAERDFSSLLTSFGRYMEGECTYCNHCLPCPEVIDIGQVNRLLDAAQWGVSRQLRVAYDALSAPASACTECGACTMRCPFGVEVVLRMQQAAQVFEAPVAQSSEVDGLPVRPLERAQ